MFSESSPICRASPQEPRHQLITNHHYQPSQTAAATAAVAASPPQEAGPASLLTAFETPPAAGLGELDRLPVEMVLAVLGELDVRSYLRFRQANRRARALATAHRDYAVAVAGRPGGGQGGPEGLAVLRRVLLLHHHDFAGPGVTFAGLRRLAEIDWLWQPQAS
ncbi:hypothetical protein GGR56DRAFT_670846 [Xylariaceae sp. FL0804]|nr:hypothetical protein GGR56DRAFT_670846 [Xylariaceae sp. FL0804]